MTELLSDAQLEDIGEALPKGMERRLALRLLTQWRDLCAGRAFPAFSDINPADLDDMWPNCFVLDTEGFETDPVFRIVGDVIAAKFDDSLIGKRVSFVPPGNLFYVATSYFSAVMQKEAPISRGGGFISEHGDRILYRSVLLPVSDDGISISGILGGANCRKMDD